MFASDGCVDRENDHSKTWKVMRDELMRPIMTISLSTVPREEMKNNKSLRAIEQFTSQRLEILD